MAQKSDEVRKFFYPDRISLLQPESMNAGILESGTRSDILDLDTLLSAELLQRHHQVILMNYLLFVKTYSSNLYYDEIMRRNLLQKWVFHSPFSDRVVEFEITASELKEMEGYCKYQKESAMAEFLILYYESQSDLLAVASANSNINVECLLYPKSFVYRYTFGEEFDENGNKPIENCREMYDELCEDANEDIKTLPIFHSAIRIADEYEKDIIFRFRDHAHTDSIDFVVYSP